MRSHRGEIASVSWIPQGEVPPLWAAAFEAGVLHYDPEPKPCHEDRSELDATHDFRFSNRFAAQIRVENGDIIDFDYGPDDTRYGVTTVRLPGFHHAFASVPFPTLRRSATIERDDQGTFVRFTQTAGCRAALPAPRPVPARPFVQFVMPPIWTTLSILLRADGRGETQMLACSQFPRHHFYRNGERFDMGPATDFDSWNRDGWGRGNPWRVQKADAALISPRVPTYWTDETAAGLVHAAFPGVPTRQAGVLARRLRLRDLRPGEVLLRQGEAGDTAYIILEGRVEVVTGPRDEETVVGELGSGSLVGEIALLTGQPRTATVRPLTPTWVAAITRKDFERALQSAPEARLRIKRLVQQRAGRSI